MKKLVLVLAVLLISLPAMAAVTITAECDGDVYTVSYATDGNNVRAFALDISVDAGTIDAVGSLNADYDIYPGSIVIVDGEVNDAGSAVCDDAYPDTLGGMGTAGCTIEMGSLYADGELAPATSGVLCTFTVSDTAAIVTIAENGIRGGIVMEDPEEDVAVTIDVICDPGPDPCPGDVDGDTWVSPNDVTSLVGFLNPYADVYYWVEVTPETVNNDVDGDGWVSPNDVTALVGFLNDYAASYYWVQCGTF